MAKPLFVYGTLLTHIEHPMGQLLLKNGSLREEGHIRARLYWIDDPEEPGNQYPGAIPSGYEDDRVYGEIWDLVDPNHVLHQFDLYEACDDGRPEPHEFQRKSIPVTCKDGSVIVAVSYLYCWDTSRATPIPSGRFTQMPAVSR